MHKALLVLPLLLALLVPAAPLHVSDLGDLADPRGQSPYVPRHAVAPAPSDMEVEPARLRRALQSLLDLNDGELQALMLGASPPSVAPRLAPPTAFFLAATRHHLAQLHTLLQTAQDDVVQESTWNPKIARRRKKSHRRTPPPLDNDYEDDPGSILGALSELSQYLAGGEVEADRSRRSHHTRGHKHLSHTSIRQDEDHYLYYLRSSECPAAHDGHPRMFCPSASQAGKWVCIEDRDLCDGRPQCPNHEDEDLTHCLFYKAMTAHMDSLQRAVLMRG